MTEPIVPPVEVTQRELLRAARTIASLQQRRRTLLKKLDELNHNLRSAKRLLTELAAALAATPLALEPGGMADDDK